MLSRLSREKKFLFFGGVVFLVLVGILTSRCEGASQKAVKEKSPVKTVEPSIQEDSVEIPTESDKNQARGVVDKFIPLYTTYQIEKMGDMVKEIQPFVTEQFYKNEASNIGLVRPTAEMIGFQFSKMEKPIMGTDGEEITWANRVTVELINVDKKKTAVDYSYIIRLKKKKGEWRISEVNFHEYHDE
ncbi:hypothetical protein [Thermoactinomyces sp. DSM 45892]|uniref:hypothetical protein n=1 Tax=Thermoactinomyces sp. DSM 45892 TaxID=1882753 RepID=UPI00089D88DD|nr:hypothetical protein [Thermoactinomyces sp. DSM 45892]SDY82784.1 hypothetical protein SAMN05444416_1098 [Thermoactinomyces sp. DSM 45892]